MGSECHLWLISGIHPCQTTLLGTLLLKIYSQSTLDPPNQGQLYIMPWVFCSFGKLHLMLAYQQLLSSFSSQHQSTHLQTLVQFTHSHLRLIAPMCHISLKSFDSINRTSVLAVKKSSNSALTQFLSSRNFVCFLESYVLGPSLLHIVPHCLWTRDQSGHILFMTKAEARRTSPST